MNSDLMERLDIAAWVSQGERPERWTEVHQCYRDDIRKAREGIFAELAAAGYAVVKLTERIPGDPDLVAVHKDLWAKAHAAMIAAAEQEQKR